jgi:hypothetical protein
MALSAARNTQSLGDTLDVQDYPVATGVTIWQGSLVALSATGFATPGAAAATLFALGRAKSTVVNAGADGAKTVAVETGTFKWKNSGSGDAIAQAEVGDFCWIVDDETVAKTSNSGARSRAGRITKVDSGGVWVTTSFSVPQDVVTLTGDERLTTKVVGFKSAVITFAANAATITAAQGGFRFIDATAGNSVVTLSTSGAVAGDVIHITRGTAGAQSVALTCAGAGTPTLMTMTASKKAGAVIGFDGTNWRLVSSYQEP